MLTSWKNFFFAAFEPGGSVTVDKPPLGFWIQAVFAYFLGVNGLALALPQALAGLLSIPLLYTLVKRHFGVFAGLIAALALAVVPVTIATERNNTIGFEILTVSKYPDYAGVVTIATIILWLVGMGLLLICNSKSIIRSTVIMIAVLSMLVAPFTWSLLTTLNSDPNIALPTAGASTDQRSSRNTPDFIIDARTETILDFLLENTDPKGYLLATQNAREAAPYILATSRPVLTFGGFMGSDDIIDLQEFKDMVEHDEIQYVLGIPTQKPEIAQWMRHNCLIINPNTGETVLGFVSIAVNNPGNPQGGRPELYDCRIS